MLVKFSFSKKSFRAIVANKGLNYTKQPKAFDSKILKA